jgi:hypothetical protein
MNVSARLERGRKPRRALIRWLAIGVAAVFLVLVTAGSGCVWVSLGYNAIRYPTTATGESANVVIHGVMAYGSLAERGLEIVDLENTERRNVLPPPGSESIDDVAIADELLFALDARRPGHLSVFSLSDPAAPVLASAPVEVGVGPFSGVSAGGGRVVVSGGTSLLTLRTYDPNGRLSPEVATIDLGRGQPDVLIAPGGETAFVSTHYRGPHFGLTTVEVGRGPKALLKAGAIDLDTYGFTAGGAKPANFPIECALIENVLLVAHARGLAVISVDNLREPRLLSVLGIGVEAVSVDVDGDMAAVVGSSPQPLLVLLDVSVPSSPVIKRSIPLPEGSYPTSVAVGPYHIAVSAHEKGLLIYQRRGWSVGPERKPR